MSCELMSGEGFVAGGGEGFEAGFYGGMEVSEITEGRARGSYPIMR